MGFDFQTHRTVKGETGDGEGFQTNHYMAIGGANGRVLLRSGTVWTDDGIVVDPVPEWVWSEMELLSDKALAAVGFIKRSKSEPEAAEPAKSESRAESRAQVQPRASKVDPSLKG
jgi:hypothetical protein